MKEHLRVVRMWWKSDSTVGTIAAILLVGLVFLPTLRQLYHNYQRVGK